MDDDGKKELTVVVLALFVRSVRSFVVLLQFMRRTCNVHHTTTKTGNYARPDPIHQHD